MNVDGTPFFAIAEALGVNTHTRKMAGALVAMFPDIDCRETIADECASPEFAAPMTVVSDYPVHTSLVHRGLLPAAGVHKYAENLDRFTDEAINEPEFKTTMAALGSPYLGESRALELIHKYSPGTKLDDKAHVAISNALLGNPLVHNHIDFVVPKPENAFCFFKNAAWFGNLDKLTLRLSLAAMISDVQSPGRIAVSRALISRGTIPSALALMLDKIPDLGFDLCHQLAQLPVHQRLVRDGLVQAFKLIDAGKRNAAYVTSPVADGDEIRKFAEKASARTSLLWAANCPRDLYLSVIKENHKATASYSYCKYSPWAERSMTATANPWGWVKHTLKENNINDLHLLALPVVPFNDIRPEQLAESFVPGGVKHTAAIIVGAIRSRKFLHALGQIGDNPENDIAFLFSPRTSGRQLEKLATLHPELAGLAAVHPNGGDIPLDNVAPRHKAIVEASRETLLLSARAEPHPQTSGAEIVL